MKSKKPALRLLRPNDEPPPRPARSPLRFLGLAASPRAGGNSERLLDACLEFAAGAGATVDKIRLSEATIAPCRACESCHAAGRCRIHDDMTALYRLLWRADVTILAAPIYFYGLPAQAKAMVDRCQALWARKKLLGRRRPRGRGVLLAVGATRGARLFDGATLTAKYWMDTFYTTLAATRLYGGVEEIGDIGRRRDALADAAMLGLRLASDRRFREDI
jgi:multimeric flavodoxin WrbA